MCQSHQRAANQVLVFHMGQCKGRHCIRVYPLISHGYYPRISRQLPVGPILIRMQHQVLFQVCSVIQLNKARHDCIVLSGYSAHA